MESIIFLWKLSIPIILLGIHDEFQEESWGFAKTEAIKYRVFSSVNFSLCSLPPS